MISNEDLFRAILFMDTYNRDERRVSTGNHPFWRRALPLRVIRVGLAVLRRLPVYPGERTFSG